MLSFRTIRRIDVGGESPLPFMSAGDYHLRPTARGVVLIAPDVNGVAFHTFVGAHPLAYASAMLRANTLSQVARTGGEPMG